MNRSGFTLIELLLSLAIFTIIAFGTTQQLRHIVSTKNQAFSDLDMYSELRAAVTLMRTDLSQAFHIQYDDLGADNKQALLANQQIPHTLFDGRKNELIFTSLSHRVYYAGKRECEQTEISYFLQRRDGFKYPSLMKRESEIIDADLYTGGPVFTLIDNVSTFELDYWDDKQQKWVSDWSSDGNFRDRFPMAVRLKLEVMKGNNQKLSVQTELKVAFPNNEGSQIQLQ